MVGLALIKMPGSSVNAKPVGGSPVNKKFIGYSFVISKVFDGNLVNCRINVNLAPFRA